MTSGNSGSGVTRRRFVQRGAAAMAAPWFVPASVWGAEGSTPPSERVTLECIGMGGRGTSNMRSFLGLGGEQVVAVCDVQSERRRRAAQIVTQHYGAARSGAPTTCDTYNDFRDLLARDDIDAVVISPQDHWHAPMAVAAARAGKDMYCEKPLGVAVTESQAIRDAVRRYGRVFQTGTQQRSNAKFRHACNLARSGHLGKVHAIEVAAPGPSYQPKYQGPATPGPVPEGFDYDMYLGPAPWKPFTPYRIDKLGWYLIEDYCAGFIVNWGVPSIGSRPCRVNCKSTYRTHAICDNINSWQAEFHFDDGPRMQFTDTGTDGESRKVTIECGDTTSVAAIDFRAATPDNKEKDQ